MARITVRRIIAYAAALLAVLNLLGALMFAHPSLVLFALALVVALPLGRAALSDRGIDLSGPAVWVVYLVATATGNVWLVLAAGA